MLFKRIFSRKNKFVYNDCCYWKSTAIKTGISFGSALAIVLSYTRNYSIIWAVIHGILSWFYVLYRVVESLILFGWHWF